VVKKKRLGDILIEAGLIDQKKLQEAIELQKISKERLGKILVQFG
jgi:type IV pilus assembly protein PilB